MTQILNDVTILGGAHPNVAGVKPPTVAKRSFRALFLCADNFISSIIAEALLRRWGGAHFHAFSAGINPRREIDPLAAELLKTYKLWDEGLHPKSFAAFLGSNAPSMDFIVSVGSAPPARMPTGWPGHPQVIHWRITDPRVDGTPAEKTRSFQAAFRELETRIKLFVLVHQREAARKICKRGMICDPSGAPNLRSI